MAASAPHLLEAENGGPVRELEPYTLENRPFIDDRIVLIDEIFTPDSSRFWMQEGYESGRPQHSLDKQFVRDYLDETGWDHNPPAPERPKNDPPRRPDNKLVN